MTKERGGSIVFLAAGIYGLVISIGFPLGKWNSPGPGVFPLSLSILLCAFGLVGFVQGRTKEGEKSREQQAGLLGKSGTPLRIVGITAAFILLLEPLGYLLASMLYTFTLFSMVSRYRFWIAAALAVTFGAGSWLFFTKMLSTPLPTGLRLLWGRFKGKGAVGGMSPFPVAASPRDHNPRSGLERGLVRAEACARRYSGES